MQFSSSHDETFHDVTLDCFQEHRDGPVKPLNRIDYLIDSHDQIATKIFDYTRCRLVFSSIPDLLSAFDRLQNDEIIRHQLKVIGAKNTIGKKLRKKNDDEKTDEYHDNMEDDDSFGFECLFVWVQFVVEDAAEIFDEHAESVLETESSSTDTGREDELKSDAERLDALLDPPDVGMDDQKDVQEDEMDIEIVVERKETEETNDEENVFVENDFGRERGRGRRNDDDDLEMNHLRVGDSMDGRRQKQKVVDESDRMIMFDPSHSDDTEDRLVVGIVPMRTRGDDLDDDVESDVPPFECICEIQLTLNVFEEKQKQMTAFPLYDLARRKGGSVTVVDIVELCSKYI